MRNLASSFLNTQSNRMLNLSRFYIVTLILISIFSCNKIKEIDTSNFEKFVEEYEREKFAKKRSVLRVFEKTGFAIESISDIDTIRVKDSLKLTNKEIEFHLGKDLDIDKEIQVSKQKYEFVKKNFDSVKSILKDPRLKKVNEKSYKKIQKRLANIEWNLFEIKSMDDKLTLLKKQIDKYKVMDSLKPLCIKFNAKYIINEKYNLINSNSDFEYYDVYNKDYLTNVSLDSLLNVREYGKRLKKVKNK